MTSIPHPDAWPSSTGQPALPATPVLPARAGVGLKPEHFAEILDTRPDIGFFEIHAENYLVDGGPFHYYLTRIREQYPLSIHGVGLSIGSQDPLDLLHLKRLRLLLDRYQPESFSEHLAWSTHGDIFLNDLLPVPYTPETLNRVCRHIEQVQEALRRPMLLENPATYVEFANSVIPEPFFIQEVVRRTGCGLLLDINNIHVSCSNHHRDPRAYLEALPLSAVGEIHLAGFTVDHGLAGDPLLIDSHGAPIALPVWRLYEYALARLGPRPTLIERDNDIPALDELRQEADAAERLLRAVATQGEAREYGHD